MIEWRRVPWPLWAYAVVLLTGAILIEVQAHGPIMAKAFYPFVMLVWLYFLFKGVRWVWVITVGIYILGLVIYLLSLMWQGAGMSLIGILLLLHPVTRRYFDSHTATADA